MHFTLDDRQRRELWGLALCALALLLLLSLVPPAVFGAAAARHFPTGNIVGWVGAALHGVGWAVLGLPVLLLPVLPGLWGLVAFDRLSAAAATRWSLLLGAVVLLLPPLMVALAHPADLRPESAGWLGHALGGMVVSALGWVGAALVLVVTLAAASVATHGWNPLGGAVRGSRVAWANARVAAGRIPLRLPERPRLRSTFAEPGPEPWDDATHELPDAVAAVVGATEAEPEASAATRAPLRARLAGRLKRPAVEESVVAAEDPADVVAMGLPPTALLSAPPVRDEQRSRHELDSLGTVLVDKLATFKVEGRVVGMTTGPVVTQFEVEPAPGVKVARIASLEADLALAMRAPSIRILAPIPGKAAVGVEVPNPEPQMVYFREVIEATAFRASRAQLPVALGKDIAGVPYVADLAKTPHLLIAGATGSGKSVCVNTIITSLVYRHSPRTLRLLMVDPKMVELSMYNDLPHLRHPVVTDNSEAAGVLKWAVIEMERRYALLSANGVRNLQDFNGRIEAGQLMRTPDPSGDEGDPDRWVYRDGPLPFIVVIIDELADLMMTVQGEVEKPIALLAQKARAIGIHLILATQRPSVNVITGLIKANFPSRIAFRVASKVDSRTILDQNGADALLGNGDMLFLPPGRSDAVRIQGAFLSTDETESLMRWYREQADQRRAEALAEGRDPDAAVRGNEPDILELVRATEGDGDAAGGADEPQDRDKLFRDAAELCIQHQGGSTSLLQRRLRIGYGRAARIIDQLHHAGVLGPPDGSKPRDVLVDLLQLDQVCPDD
jgi:DNA segregation ATPase FtsK/SpoIIIE, S-DNA-T family